MTKKILLLFFMFAGFQANASIIQQSGDGLDWQYDDVSGLQWLDLTYTDGMSISDALDSYSGWEVATKSQFTDMYSQYDGGAFGDTTVLSYSCAVSSKTLTADTCYRYGDSGFEDDLFSASFGSTRFGSRLSSLNGRSSTYWSSYGLFFDEDSGDYRMGGSHVYLAADRVNGLDQLSSFFNGDPRSFVNIFTGSPDYGVFLVRTASVPEPASIALMSLGIAGLVFGRRRRQS